LKVGIISDSHRKIGRAKRGIDFLKSQGAEYIIHSGDIVKIEILEYLKQTGLVYLAVYGNNDTHLFEHHKDFNLVQEPYYFKIQDIKFKLMHHPYFMTPDVDMIIYGHTHIQHSQINNKTLFINSGEVCARDKPISTVSLVEILDSEFIVHSYERQLKTDKWTDRTFRYLRK
jgi:putative phosphoesterase